MRRREFIALSLSGLVGSRARAQSTKKVWRIGFLSGRARPATFEGDAHGAFLDGMRDLGHREGTDFTLEWRFAAGEFGRLPVLAADLVRANVDVIVTSPAIATRAARDATSTIPVVFAYVSNPVASGLVASLANPGGNVTGLAVQQSDISPKQLQLITQAAPRVAKIAVLSNPTNEGSAVLLKSVHEAIEKAGLALLPLPAPNPEAIDRGIARLKGASDTALLVLPDPFFSTQRHRIVQFAIDARLPSMFGEPGYARAGGLMSYGDPLAKFIQRTAYFVDRIMKGAKPPDLPVEQPTQFHFTLNLTTAKAIGLEIPSQLLARADEVIE